MKEPVRLRRLAGPGLVATDHVVPHAHRVRANELNVDVVELIVLDFDAGMRSAWQ